MKKIATYLTIILLCACGRKDPSPDAVTLCGVFDPVNNLPWLRQFVMDTDIDVVTSATYQGKTYINLYGYSWSCTTCRLYECDGSRIDYFQLPPADRQELDKLLFSPETQVIYKRKQ